VCVGGCVALAACMGLSLHSGPKIDCTLL
jgi:hypothetical protein